MDSTASRLCKACGLCCTGVLFHTVRLQPSESAQTFKALGMLLQHKKKYDFFNQPCTSFKENCCSIYAQRPLRCKLFECQQLKRLATGETTEVNALETILKAHHKVDQVQKLLQLSGPMNFKRPLSKQYANVTAEPLDGSAGSEALALRSKLTEAFEDLNQFLNHEFRNEELSP